MAIDLLINRSIINRETLGEALIQFVEENLNIQQWGFSLAFTSFAETSSLLAIYDSQWCRVSFALSRQQISRHDEFSVEYGRLHASNDKPFMEWGGEKCRCWHTISMPLRFLDGLSPLEAMEQLKIQNKAPDIIETFSESEIGKKLLYEYPPKAALVMHARIWEQYGQRLFELFDLRRPDLWEQYRSFLQEYYRLIDRKSSWGPPYENVC